VTAREYLFSLEQFGIKLGLEQIRALVADLGNPDQAYRSVVVAGTNGKGSVTAMVERAVRAAGLRTGRYTSPHLTDIEERVAINGEPITAATFDALAERIREAADRLPAPPTFFEATTALALEAFRQARVDVAILEVGLGGRLDATNVLSPMGVAITAIDFDHEAYLGTTLEAIAGEKAGIIKPGGWCVLGRNAPAVRAVVEARCETTGAALVNAPEGTQVAAELVNGRTRVHLLTPHADYADVMLALRGRHQVDNAVTAVRLLEELATREGIALGASHIREGLEKAEWPARLELRPLDDVDVLIDGAHNPAGARALATYVREVYGRRLPFVIGVMRDKQIDAIVAELIPCASTFVCTKPASPRAASPDELTAIVRRLAPDLPVRGVEPASQAVREAASCGNPIVVAGSLYLAGEIRTEVS
jgi:dihydrofolate synthase/folylpolyglutamate synthase